MALDNPKSYILDKGGEIFVALYNRQLVGVGAFNKMLIASVKWDGWLFHLIYMVKAWWIETLAGEQYFTETSDQFISQIGVKKVVVVQHPIRVAIFKWNYY